MKVDILKQPFDPWEKVRAHQRRLRPGGHGALALFVGTARDSNGGGDVEAIWLEHYPGMTEHCLRRSVEKAREAYDTEDVLVAHRIGWVVPGDAIVAVAVWAARRHDAYAVNRAVMEELKSKAPFWKKEKFADGDRWVGQNTPAAMETA